MSDQALGKVYLIHAVNKIIYSEKGNVGKGTPYFITLLLESTLPGSLQCAHFTPPSRCFHQCPVLRAFKASKATLKGNKSKQGCEIHGSNLGPYAPRLRT